MLELQAAAIALHGSIMKEEAEVRPNIFPLHGALMYLPTKQADDLWIVFSSQERLRLGGTLKIADMVAQVINIQLACLPCSKISSIYLYSIISQDD
jgi:hypothetical protein